MRHGEHSFVFQILYLTRKWYVLQELSCAEHQGEGTRAHICRAYCSAIKRSPTGQPVAGSLRIVVHHGTRPGVPLVGGGYDGDLSMQMSMVMEALTCPGKVLLLIKLLMVLGRMGTSGDGRVG